MRSSVSYILSHATGESVMSHPDYAQQAQHHACLLILVKSIGGALKNFNRLWERIQRVNSIKVTDSSGEVRDIYVRYVRDYPVENNDWGDFQTHRRLLGLITLCKFTNQIELNEVCRVHESLKIKYSNTLYDSRAFMFGPHTSKPQPEPDQLDVARRSSSVEDNERTSIPSETSDSLGSNETFPLSSTSEDNYTTPSNFKTHAMFYNENDLVNDLEQNVSDLINSLFWVVESKRLERSKEKLDKVSLILAPFEKKDFVGLDMESRNNKKRCNGRVKKNLADLTLQAGLISEALSLYHAAALTLESVNDWLWLGAAYEGLCAASAILLYPNLRNTMPLHRNASLQESSANKLKPLSLTQSNSDVCKRLNLAVSPLKTKSPLDSQSDTPTSTESLDSSRMTETESSESITSIGDEHNPKSLLTVDLPSLPKLPSMSQFMLNSEEIAEKYRKAMIYYSNYKSAGIIETEASFKAARLAVEQQNSLQASIFLQNVILINLTLSEQEKIQRFDTLAELYKEIGFFRKAALCQRLAASRQVSPGNPHPDWNRCYHLMLQTLHGYKLTLDPNRASSHPVGWPILQIQLLHELVVAAKRMGHPALATRHMTFMLQTMWPHLTQLERRDAAIQLQALSAQCEGGPVPLVLESGEVIPPANLTRVPYCHSFTVLSLSSCLTPHLIKCNTQQGPFIFTPIHFGSLDRRNIKTNDGKLDYLWVEDDLCEVQLKLINPLPFELKVSNMRLMTSGIVFESLPETVILPSETPTSLTLQGTAKEIGELTILGYSTHTLGIKSNCRLKTMPAPNKFPDAYKIEVIASLPVLNVDTSLPSSGNDNNVNVSLYNGESVECIITLTNMSQVPVEYINIAVQSSMDNQLQNKIFQWSNESIQSQLPIKPNESATFLLKLYGEAEFLDVGGGADVMYPSLNNCSSRVGSPYPNAVNSLPNSFNAQNSLTTGSSFQHNRLTASFRSTNSHSTNWSAPISVMAPSKGRQLEAQLIIRYSGGKSVEKYCRQSIIHFNLEFIPSVSITHWDVLPAEIPTQLYLVLDIMNLTPHEMELYYSTDKHILIECNDSCRVPVPLERCPLNVQLYNECTENHETRSTNTGSSTNSLEQMLSSHITKVVKLKWKLLSEKVRQGIANLTGITLSHTMMDIVTVSPFNWEVSVNSQLIKPQEELNCKAGECLQLAVSIDNQLARPLYNLCLSVQFYQDYNNGVINYKLDNRVAYAGQEKLILNKLVEEGSAHHACSVIFLTPGEFKMDIQCSTCEPIMDDLHDLVDGKSFVTPCNADVTHTWRFIPAVAITVSD